MFALELNFRLFVDVPDPRSLGTFAPSLGGGTLG